MIHSYLTSVYNQYDPYSLPRLHGYGWSELMSSTVLKDEEGTTKCVYPSSNFRI